MNDQRSFYGVFSILLCFFNLWSQVIEAEEMYSGAQRRELLPWGFSPLSWPFAWLPVCRRIVQPSPLPRDIQGLTEAECTLPHHHPVPGVGRVAALHPEREHVRKVRNTPHPSRDLRGRVWRALCPALSSCSGKQPAPYVRCSFRLDPRLTDSSWAFPGSAVVRTRHFHCRDPTSHEARPKIIIIIN